jgi:hypothetical protein
MNFPGRVTHYTCESFLLDIGIKIGSLFNIDSVCVDSWVFFRVVSIADMGTKDNWDGSLAWFLRLLKPGFFIFRALMSRVKNSK